MGSHRAGERGRGNFNNLIPRKKGEKLSEEVKERMRETRLAKKPFTQALRKIASMRAGDRIEDKLRVRRGDTYAMCIGKHLYAKALSGHVPAIKVLFDRVEGTPRQSIELSTGSEVEAELLTVRERIAQMLRPPGAIVIEGKEIPALPEAPTDGSETGPAAENQANESGDSAGPPEPAGGEA